MYDCIEHGLELNVENVRKSSRQHKRCGTSFLFFVMIVSIIFSFFITAESQVLRVLLRIAMLPLIAGVFMRSSVWQETVITVL